RTLLHLGDAAGNADHHADVGREELTARIDHLDHALDHLLGGLEIGDHPVLQGTHGLDVLMRLAMHLLRLPPDGDHLAGGAVLGHDARLVHHHLVVMDDQGVRRAQVDRDLLGEKVVEPAHGGSQCLKCLLPVTHMAVPRALQASMLSWSRMLPPGCTMAVIPAFAAISTQSGKGKKASLAITEPCRSKLNLPALAMACSKASTRLVCPVPLPSSCRSLASTMALLLVCFTRMLANSRSWSAVAEGDSRVTVRISAARSTSWSESWDSMPLSTDRNLREGAREALRLRMMRFFFLRSSSNASGA